jgi:hypothetical protein
MRAQAGVVLLIMMLFIFISSMAAGSMVRIYATDKQREREDDLLYCGDQYRKAIVSYSSLFPPGGIRTLPKSLNDLLSDERFPVPVQHIRKLCLDPMTGKLDWELVLLNGRIAGVHSRSMNSPLKKSNFPIIYTRFESAQTYEDWIFLAKTF